MWFLIGAGLGVVQMGVSLVRKPISMGHPIQGFAVAAILGAAIYGTILWLVATFILKW